MGEAGESDELFRQYRSSRDRGLRNQLVEQHQGLAITIARRYVNRGEGLDDLTQVALVGLLKAVERYDPDRGARFASFAAPTISGELKRHFRDRTWRVKVSRRDKDLSLRARERIPTLTQTLGRAPRMSEVADDLDVTTEDLLTALEAREAYRPTSIERPAAGEGTSIGDRLGSADVRLEAAADLLALDELIAELPERERTILRLRFDDELTQSEIAEQVGISQMHVSRVLRRTLRVLRAQLELPADGSG
ncbi:MAG: SigB/SigF/SigG family RNA polymerase sigma factor [Actinomycetota bacterium]